MRTLFALACMLAIASGCRDREHAARYGVPIRYAILRPLDVAQFVPGASTYVIQPQSRFDVHTGTAGWFGGLAHAHLVRAKRFSGSVDYDPRNPGAMRAQVTVFTEALEVLTPESSGNRAKIGATMRKEVLHVDRYPEITFASRRAEPVDGGVRLLGDLTMVGRTRPVDVVVTLDQRGDQLVARGHFTVRQTDFGIRPYRAGLGTIRVADPVTFDFEAIGALPAGAHL